MSPLRSSAGPAIWRMPTPSSLRTICASEVLPRPGRPGEQDVVERLAARLRRVERDRELLLHALLAHEVGERLRAQRTVELFLGLVQRRREEPRLAHAACFRAARTCSSTGSSSSTPASARSASSSDHPSSTSASRASSDAVSGTGDSRSRVHDLLLQLEHDPLCGLAPDAGDRLEACGVLAHDRAAELLGGRPGDDRERDLRPHARDAEQELEQLPLVGGREAVELERVLPHTRYVSTVVSSPTRALTRGVAATR